MFEPYEGVLSDPRPSDTPLFEDGLGGCFDLRPEHQEVYAEAIAIPMPNGTMWQSDATSWPGAVANGRVIAGPDYVPVDLEYVRSLPVLND